MFPIGWMYYFGINPERRFAVPDFWPKPEQTNKIPHEREDIANELDRLKRKRLERRAQRLQEEERVQGRTETAAREELLRLKQAQPEAKALRMEELGRDKDGKKKK